MADLAVKVVRVEESQAFALPGGAQKFVRTTYTVGDHGPFTIDLKEADYNAAAVKAKMEERAATLRALV